MLHRVPGPHLKDLAGDEIHDRNYTYIAVFYLQYARTFDNYYLSCTPNTERIKHVLAIIIIISYLYYAVRRVHTSCRDVTRFTSCTCSNGEIKITIVKQ